MVAGLRMVADQAQAALGVEVLAVEGDDAGGFLAAMLKSMQAERGQCGGIRMAEYPEHPAFFAQAIAIEIELALTAGWHHAAFLNWDSFRRRSSVARWSFLPMAVVAAADQYLGSAGPCSGKSFFL